MDQAAFLFKKGETEKTMEMKFLEKMLLVLSEELKMKTLKSIQSSKFRNFCLKHSVEKHVTCFSVLQLSLSIFSVQHTNLLINFLSYRMTIIQLVTIANFYLNYKR